MEKSLVEIIGEILGLKEFSVTTELNYLGFASISAIKLATKIYKKFGVNIPVKKFLNGTVETIENEILQNWMSGQVAEIKKSAALKSAKISGGEKYPETLLKKLQQITNARIFNTYVPTKTTISSNMKDLTHAKNISVGRLFLNVTEFIVDGELYIGGAGYNELPEMTTERFIEYNGLKVYKSGDFARWTEDGNVEILGRMDNQIKLRSLIIEIGEVESALAKVSRIKTVAVKIIKLKISNTFAPTSSQKKFLTLKN